jgi:biopolymer transport protein ExbD
MAGISTGGSEGGKRAVDHEIPLIPFIDLLLCCIMFLLVTAVWNQLKQVHGDLDVPSPSCIDCPPPPDERPTTLRITAHGYVIQGNGGDEIRVERAPDAPYDVVALRQRLTERRNLIPNEERMIVTADDGVVYADLVQAMDVLNGAGYAGVTISGS